MYCEGGREGSVGRWEGGKCVKVGGREVWEGRREGSV